MFNLFKKPFEKSSLEAWAKMSDDIAKVAILAIPVILYGNDTSTVKIINTVLLVFAVYWFLLTGRIFRKQTQEKTQ